MQTHCWVQNAAKRAGSVNNFCVLPRIGMKFECFPRRLCYTTNSMTRISILTLLVLFCQAERVPAAEGGDVFDGAHYRGGGDVEYVRLLDTARRMFEPDPELQNISMLYMPRWDGFVEGPTWDAWWIQNSYGTTYCALPFYREPWITFLQNAQDLWFDQMGDGKRAGAGPPFNWVAPDGCLCDCARPGWIVYRQGDGRTDIHDWAVEFTAAGVLMQSELLLISRDPAAIAHYLPKLERCAAFLEKRRDPVNNLFLAGPAGNLLAPSYAGWAKPDGTYGKAYLAGLSITYIAALDRLIEVEKLAGRKAMASQYETNRALAKAGLPRLITPAGYFMRSLDPDGVEHGVLGAARHAYFESSPNHDAIAFRVASDAESEKIYNVIASLPGLRPYDFILPNYPSYDDLYVKPEGIWTYGTWVNGGHWSTCEARMMLAYYRLGKFGDAEKSMERLMTFARRFRMDNPLVKFGSDVYQPSEPINLCYDTFGPAAGLMRGLFEFLYTADGLTLAPHIPPGITELEQKDPVRFGKKLIYLSTVGSGPVTGVLVNGRKTKRFDAKTVFLPYAKTPDTARVIILLGGAKAPKKEKSPPVAAKENEVWAPDARLAGLDARAVRLRDFLREVGEAGLGNTYVAAHAQVALECIKTAHVRFAAEASGAIKPLADPRSQKAADQSYIDAATKLCDGLENVIKGCENSPNSGRRRFFSMWTKQNF